MNDLFRQYYARLRRGGIVKSLLWGVAVGFLAAFVAALVTWMTYFDGFFLTIGVFVAVAAATALICYFRFFRPTAKDVARKVDSLGLEERMITMLELEKSDDYIALRQREDAQRSLQKLGMNKFKFGISLALVLVLSIGGVFALSMTTVTGLSDLGVIPSGAQLIDEAAGRNPRNYVDVVYSAMEGGYIYGESEQNLRKGEQSSTVIAVADDGYRFYRWTDGYPYPARTDVAPDEDITFTAWFLPMDADGAAEAPDSDEATDQPPEDGNSSGGSATPPDTGQSPPNYDYVYDWLTQYKDVLGDYYTEAMEQLATNGELSDDLRLFFETYFSTIS